jgi:propionyl-CoA synthetase
MEPLGSDATGGRGTTGDYEAAYSRSLADPSGFWLDAAKAVDWKTFPAIGLDDEGPNGWQWFTDGILNTSYNALDRHVKAGRGTQVALAYISTMTGAREQLTYDELLDRVARFAGALRRLGVDAGDRVVIYLPMIPEAVIAMLACARIGAIHSVVFGGFAAPELASRIDDAHPKAILTASGGLEPTRTVEYLPTVAKAIELSTHPAPIVVVKNRAEVTGSAADDPAWLDWDDIARDSDPVEAVPMHATDPLYILYTSGTSGKPKGVLRDHGGHAVALTWAMRNVYDIQAGDVFWAASDVGWVVGHSNIVYGPLLVGATTVLYEGKPVGTPDAGIFWKIVEEYGVKALFAAPTAIRAIRRVDPDGAEIGKYDLTSLETLFTAGERLDPDTYDWATAHLARPVVDHWWQTETGWAICANLRGLDPLPLVPGSPTKPVPGYDVVIVDRKGKPVADGTQGNIVVKLPLPPGVMTTLWNDSTRYRESYLDAFPGYYLSGDYGYFDENGYIFVLGRTDDVINVAGHRLSTGSVEEALSSHPAVAEVSVIGIADEIKGEVPLAFVVLHVSAYELGDGIAIELIELVRRDIGAVAAPKEILIVAGLPKTRSGKILRRSLRQIAAGEQVNVPPTIEDPQVLQAIADHPRFTNP